MHPLLLALSLASAPVAGDAEVAAPLDPPGAVAPSAHATAPAAPGSGSIASRRGPAEASLGATGSSAGSVVLPGLALLALAAVAFTVSRRKAATGGRLVDVLETAPLGPRRSLVIARFGGEALVLGVSEAGVELLASRPAAELDRARNTAAPSQPAATFESLLGETLEHQELRRKLQQGGVGSVR